MATDSFSYADGALAGNSFWVQDAVMSDPVIVASGTVYNTNFGTNGAAYRTDSSVASSQAKYIAGFAAGIGVAIHLDGSGNGYVYRADGQLLRFDAGSDNFLGGDFVPAADGDILRIYRDGSDVVATLNGVEHIRATSTTYTSGYDGLLARTSFASALDDWDNGAGGGGPAYRPQLLLMGVG